MDFAHEFCDGPIRAQKLFPVLRRTARRRRNRQSEGKDFSPTIWRLAVGLQMPSLLWHLAVGAPALERANWSRTQNFEWRRKYEILINPSTRTFVADGGWGAAMAKWTQIPSRSQGYFSSGGEILRGDISDSKSRNIKSQGLISCHPSLAGISSHSIWRMAVGVDRQI